MDGNGQHRNSALDGQVLHWPGRVLAAEDLRGSLNGHRELVLSPGAVITPLAADHLRHSGIQITRREAVAQPATGGPWGYAQERAHPLVQSAIESLRRDGIALQVLGGAGEASTCRWAKGVAECVAGGACRGGVLFCHDPELVCCVANKVTGLRAAAVSTVSQAARAMLTLGANLLVVEMPGRTFFEVRQILRTLCAQAEPVCPAGVACTLQELDGHAHR